MEDNSESPVGNKYKHPVASSVQLHLAILQRGSMIVAVYWEVIIVLMQNCNETIIIKYNNTILSLSNIQKEIISVENSSRTLSYADSHC